MNNDNSNNRVNLTTEEVGALLHDFMSIKPEDYEKLFGNIDDAISFNGHYWKHNLKSGFFSESFKFDKYVHEVAYKAVKGLNPQTSVVARKNTKQLAEPHLNNSFILKMDFKSYYENIDFEHISDSLLKANVSKELCDYIEQFYFTNGKSLRRGLRASPILSEFVGIKVDNVVNKALYELSAKQSPYTRFYDDLFISSNDKESLRSIEKKIAEEFEAIGLKVNDRKTRIQPTHTANVLGLRIHQGKLLVPKKFKKKLRARINSLRFYLDDLHRSGGWEDSDEVYEAKRRIGTVIGSHWYIINNSSGDTNRYSKQLDHYMEVLADYSRRLNELLGSDDEDVLEYADY